jgi:hypothetical protein
VFGNALATDSLLNVWLVSPDEDRWRKLLLLSALVVAIVMTLSMFAPQFAAFFRG